MTWGRRVLSWIFLWGDVGTEEGTAASDKLVDAVVLMGSLLGDEILSLTLVSDEEKEILFRVHGVEWLNSPLLNPFFLLLLPTENIFLNLTT
jgi:hypothetical protein